MTTGCRLSSDCVLGNYSQFLGPRPFAATAMINQLEGDFSFCVAGCHAELSVGRCGWVYYDVNQQREADNGTQGRKQPAARHTGRRPASQSLEATTSRFLAFLAATQGNTTPHRTTQLLKHSGRWM
ncbi:unnamed protein product [Gadus morhua 'NCC']